jgi:hypothetical protein
MSKKTWRGIAYTRVLATARKQLDQGTEIESLIDAAGELREFDPDSPLIGALEARIKRAAQVRFIVLRAKLAEQASLRIRGGRFTAEPALRSER